MVKRDGRSQGGRTRRAFLSDAALTAGALAISGTSPVLAGVPQPDDAAPQRARSAFRFVFMPCVHLRRDWRSPEGFATALQAVNKLRPAPDFVMTGGDMCHNMRDQTMDQSVEICDTFLKLYKENCRLPVHHCLGNHDLAAWNKAAESAGDPRYGKNLTLQKFTMKHRYYSFDHEGWHMVVLDYMKVTAPGQFLAEIDGEQLAWLSDDLAASRQRPAIVVTHAPVVSTVELFSDRAKRTEDALAVPFGRVISNAPALLDAVKPGNVRAFVSGHLHLVERLELLGHTFICSGSTSGHQWTGPRMGTPEGFGVFDCRADGTFEFRYETFGWKAQRA